MAIKFLLLGGLLLTRIICCAQNGNTSTKHAALNGFDDPVVINGYHNQNSISLNAMQKVDSVGHTRATGKHFGEMYNKVMRQIAIKMQDRDSVEKHFIIIFETSFAWFFLNACEAEKNANLSVSSEWKRYFSSHDIEKWQFVLLGINTHTNSDMWQALVNNFSENEIRKNKKQFLAFQPSIAKEYWPFFEQIIIQNSYLKFINSITNGIVEKLGERILYKWRRRQVNLAILYYHDPEKFKKRLAVINRKKHRIDKLIVSKSKFL